MDDLGPVEAFPGQEIDYDDSHAPDNPLAKKKPKSGGFQSMGLSPAVYKSVMRKGYKVPPRHHCAPTAARHARGVRSAPHRLWPRLDTFDSLTVPA